MGAANSRTVETIMPVQAISPKGLNNWKAQLDLNISSLTPKQIIKENLPRAATVHWADVEAVSLTCQATK